MEGVLDLNWPSVQEAKEYVERHHLEQLFKNLTALLILKQPRDPFEYVRRQLMKMTKYTFFEEHDLEILYDVLDTERTGCLTKEKCAIALKTLGLGETSMEFSTNCVPKASFILDCQIALQDKWDLFVTGRRMN